MSGTVEILFALALGLIVPALAIFLVALTYRVARGSRLPIRRTVHVVLALIGLSAAVVGLFSVLTKFTDPSTSGPNIPVGLAILNIFLVMGVWVIARPPTRPVAA